MTTFLIILGVIVGINLLSLLINQILLPKDLAGITPRGELLEVQGKRMHLRKMGSGALTIVLLPGLGVPLPSVDFRPLMEELAETHTVVCIEYFGYGFSDQTDTPRTNENYTEEIRESLSTLGLKPPYVLMPYSASGIYCEYYAAKYPEEVEALILLDTTSSAQKEVTLPKFTLTLSKIQNAIGFGRFLNPLLAIKLMGLHEKNGYTKQEIREL